MSDQLSNNPAYAAAVTYLYDLINFEMRPHDRYMSNKLDQSRPMRLMAELGHPEQQFPAIHIAGTKGKGSVAAMCAYSLRSAGLRVGLYTSPHVQEFRERIRILTPDDADGRISEEAFVILTEAIKQARVNVPDMTWFEAVTAVAFAHFAQQQVDIAVVEVGLGGRLDATNVLTPLVSVITSLSLDHTEFLGNTLTDIAYEKGGIIKRGVPVVTANQQPPALERLRQIAAERDAPLTVIGDTWQYAASPTADNKSNQLQITHAPADAFIPAETTFRLGLAGSYQLENGAVALAALSIIQPQFPQLTLTAVQAGLQSVQWNGRLQTLHQSPTTPTVLLDCAHNFDSAVKLRQALQTSFNHPKTWLVFGATMGKDIQGMIDQLFPLAETIIITQSSHPRAADSHQLTQQAAAQGYHVIRQANIADAFATAWQLATPDDLICVAGSIFIVGDLLNEWESLQSRLMSDED